MPTNPAIRLPFLDELDASRSWMTEPAMTRDAASVVLLRDGRDDRQGAVEVHLLLRHSKMPFAPFALVFPGGGVDGRDEEVIEKWSGPTAEQWADVLNTDASTAARVLCAAARETFEETGVLFAADDGGIPPDTAGASWEADRKRLSAKELSFADLLRARDLTFHSEFLKPWSRWTTPAFEPRRYRTWFFIAEVPSGQQTQDVSGETSAVEWSSVGNALTRAHRDEVVMFPPQVCLCLELFEFRTVDGAMASPRTVETVLPSAKRDQEGSYLSLPDHFGELAREVAAKLPVHHLSA
jgi:8-oxo-dGTP pyrophosphatase MutT (NUDIX family)